MASPATEPVVPAFLGAFEAARPGLPGAGHPWVAQLRQQGMAEFRRLGLPSRRIEAWKYTDPRRLAKIDFAPAPRPVNGLSAVLEAEVARAREAAHALVFVNGVLRPDLSRLDRLPSGAKLSSLAERLQAGDPLLAAHLGRVLPEGERPFASLNAAMMQDGFVLQIGPNTVIDEPIRVVFLTEGAETPFAVFPRNLIVAEPNSHAILLEVHRGAEGLTYLSDAVTEIVVNEGAHLDHDVMQAAGDRATHVATTLVRIGKDATYDGFAFALGAELSRAEVHAVLEGTGGDCRVDGVYLGRGGQHIDNTTLIEHASPNGRSRQVFKGVLDGKARGVFQGKIVVRRGAQKTDGHQLSRALLLSREAEIDAKPELEIYADDVKCSHGATAGEIDEQALFYLRSRGIDEDAARGLLVHAFLAEAIEAIPVEAVRDEFIETVAAWLEARRAQGGEG